MRIPWEGIPERYWPDTNRPWRVAWGFGCFQDFKSKSAARAFRDRMVEKDVADGGGWEKLVRGPYNAVEIKVR